jgi:hypothetical protein
MTPPRPRRRLEAVLGVLLAAPVTAEYVQAYLDVTGKVSETLFGVVFLAPMYGGAALLIRETAVRTGRGWPGILLLAAAFGVAMPGLVDLSLFTEHRSDVTGWDELWAPTAAFGMSWHPAVTWPLGHVIMSIAVPLALLDGLRPDTRGRSLLSPLGMVVLGVLGTGVALLIRSDTPAGATPTAGQTVGVLAVVLALVVLALSGFGEPRARTRVGEPRGAASAVLLGIVIMGAIDLVPPTWPGLVLVLALAAALGYWLYRAAGATSWGLSQSTAVAVGALLERTLVGYLAPLPPSAELATKLAQSTVILAFGVVVSSFALRRSRAAETATLPGAADEVS